MGEKSIICLVLFAAAWALCLGWSALFGCVMRRYRKTEGVRDGGLALLSLGGGIAFLGACTSGFEKDFGDFSPIMLVIWAIGTGLIALSSLTVSNGMQTGNWRPFD